jgi:two-component system LytT family response regulator
MLQEEPRVCYRALLVDDERLARKRLRSLLTDFPDIEVAAEADSVPSALLAVEKSQPDVVFLDIQMPGQSGFDFLEKAQGSFVTIFVTAYDHFAVRAFEANGLDYLLKPIEAERLERAVERIAGSRRVETDGCRRLEESDYLFVTSTGSSRFIQVKTIQCVTAAGAYSEVFTANAGKWLVLRSMKEWQGLLPTNQFVRIHRSALVNLAFVERLEPLPNYSYNVFLREQKAPLWMSRRCATALKGRMS